ncbi:hypothetical protein [Candidatus Cetobacterium colombiensis]|uniref:DUF3102 domain-containing protein n=1 Tax=Candidatus Cetobacterium colombiensis TaxID=3073100 RepID=A0ABU4WBR0_9FUSO|nr:hypothetical protein [Candidatus Cetobacterium colombiensis]MDX8336114.1 hypothetical protein [Candidatus Cetobacterium colombiensis]
MGLLANYKKSEVVIKKERFESSFDYAEFNEEDKENLIELEKKALHTGNLLRENLKELGDVFLEAHKIFSNNKNGMFGKWYESLGFKKDFVYLCLDRRQLSIQYNSKEIYKLPDRVIKDIKKIEKENEEIVVEILEAENPREKLKEIKESLNQNKTKENKDSRKEKIKEKLIKISKIINSNVFSDEKLLRLENILLRLEEEIL